MAATAMGEATLTLSTARTACASQPRYVQHERLVNTIGLALETWRGGCARLLWHRMANSFGYRIANLLQPHSLVFLAFHYIPS
jgi:hypothetical protein